MYKRLISMWYYIIVGVFGFARRCVISNTRFSSIYFIFLERYRCVLWIHIRTGYIGRWDLIFVCLFFGEIGDARKEIGVQFVNI